MTKLALIGAPVNASGHPEACGSVVNGNLNGESSVTVNGTPVGIEIDSSLNFPSHGHDVNEEGSCISYTSHTIQQERVSPTLSVNGKKVYLSVSEAAIDPGSKGFVDYVSSGGNDSVTINL